jgi:hypothetical protein
VATLVAFVHVLGASARDDVIDIFDVVFGDLQRAATNRGQKRRAGELREYDRAVGELRAAMLQVSSTLATYSANLSRSPGRHRTMPGASGTLMAIYPRRRTDEPGGDQSASCTSVTSLIHLNVAFG